MHEVREWAAAVKQPECGAHGPQYFHEVVDRLVTPLVSQFIDLKSDVVLSEKAGEARARSVDFKENAGSGEEATSSD